MEEKQKADILLTADRTLMSNYHHNEFLGFGTCAPPNFVPEWLFSYLFFPPIETNSHQPWTAPYGLRKTEAQLIKEGFNVDTVSPQYLGKYLKDAKVLGVHAMDPFGLGPASTTLAALFKKEPYLAKYFQALLTSPQVREAKKRGLKIIVGGPGAWQFKYRAKAAKYLGIDCVLEGEGENVVGKLFKAALEGQELPGHYEVGVGEVPSLEEIPDIQKPSINGLLEIGRGCCRGCQFCNVTLRPLRWYPLEKVERELNVNLNSGKVHGACLHAEDVMLYGSKNTTPDPEKLLKLHQNVMKRCESLSWSHCSLAAIASSPKVFGQISEIIQQKQNWWGVEIGIETGSSEIAKKIMPAKAHPFSADKWHDVVVEGMGLAHDNKLVPACTLIVGLPDETEDDITKTMDLVDDLKGMRSLIVPLFFVPLGHLTNKDWFTKTQLSQRHKELLIQCAEHDFYWVDNLLDWSFTGKWYSRVMKEFYKGFSAIAKHKVREIE
ncbi:MAG: B12-binding domain-containing radical SAM protein [Candidatus Bathyarchaeota archaeon]|nr:B12-binding domain-containing radical SAM protein [Candidatus Bathyarchaeota archaeon]